MAEADAAAAKAMAMQGGGIGGPATRDTAIVPIAASDAWYSSKPGKLITPYIFKEPLPQIIQAWRAGKIDWHDLIPDHSSLWERYGESRDSQFNFMKLVMKEVAVTDYITQYQDSGLAANFGKDFGPMRNYSSCNLVKDPCQIHGKGHCEEDSFCKWDAATMSCNTAPVRKLALPLTFFPLCPCSLWLT